MLTETHMSSPTAIQPHDHELHYTDSIVSSESTKSTPTIIIDKITLIAKYPTGSMDPIIERATKEICPDGNWDRNLRRQWGFRWRFALHVPDDDGVRSDEFGDLSIGRIDKDGGVQIRLEFNPAKVGQIGMAYLFKRVGIICGDGASGFLERAIVNRVDVAIDVAGHHLDDILISVPSHRRGSMYTSASGKADTIGIGSRRTGTYRRVYMKDEPSKVMRIEVELKPHVSFHQLPEIANPLLGMDMYELTGAVDCTTRWFMDSCHKRGMSRALKFAPPKLRKVITARVDAAKAAWWSPDLLWATWGNVCTCVGVHFNGGEPTCLSATGLAA
jgi:hypothetical protein